MYVQYIRRHSRISTSNGGSSRFRLEECTRVRGKREKILHWQWRTQRHDASSEIADTDFAYITDIHTRTFSAACLLVPLFTGPIPVPLPIGG